MGTISPILTPDLLEMLKQKQLQDQQANSPVMQPTSQVAPQQMQNEATVAQPLPPPPPQTNRSIGNVQIQPPNMQIDPNPPEPSQGVQAITQHVPSEIAPYAQQHNVAPPGQFDMKELENPAYQNLMKFQAENQRPMQSDYHPSLGRKIGAGILGGLAGLLGPQYGEQVASKVLNAPQNKKVQDYETRLADKKDAYKLENEHRKLEEELTDKESQSVQRRALAKKAEADTDLANRKGTEDWVTNKQNALPTPTPIMVHLVNGKMVNGTQTIYKDGRREIKDSEGMVIKPDAYTKLELHEAPQPKTAEQQYFAALEKEKGRELDSNDIATGLAKIASQKQTEELAGARKAASNVNVARTDEANRTLQSTGPDVVAADYKAVQQTPQHLYDLDPKQQGLVKAQMEKDHVPIPKKLTTKQIEHRDIASRSVAAANNLDALLKDPDIQANIGPLMGRWNAETRKFGLGEISGVSSEAQKKMQQFRTAAEQLFSNEVQAVTNASAREGLQRANIEMKVKPQDAAHIIQGIINQTKSYATDSLNEIKRAEYGSEPEKKNAVKQAIQDYIKEQQRSVQR